MNTHLSHLIEIANVDKEIDSFEPRITAARSELDKAIAKGLELKENVAVIGDERRDLQLKIQKNDLHIKELSAKLEGIAKKSSAIKTDKELKALDLEEEIAKEQLTFANEEIARLEKLLEAKQGEIKAIETQIEALETEKVALSESANAQIEVIKKQQQKIFQVKEKLVVKMDQKVISAYEKIRKWAKNSSVVPVRKQACGGCFIRINDKVYAEVIKSEGIVSCPHCGRILYTEVQA